MDCDSKCQRLAVRYMKRLHKALNSLSRGPTAMRNDLKLGPIILAIIACGLLVVCAGTTVSRNTQHGISPRVANSATGGGCELSAKVDKKIISPREQIKLVVTVKNISRETARLLAI